MRTIDEVYLVSNPITVTNAVPPSGELGVPESKKTTPTLSRVKLQELELTYMHNPTVFNGINKIVQTIMSADHELVCPDKKVKAWFENYLDNLGNSGTDMSWEIMLSQIYKFQCIYGRSYVEQIFNKRGNRIVDWDMIDPKKMDYAKSSTLTIVMDEFQNPVGYAESLPYGYSVDDDRLPTGLKDKVTMPMNSIFLPVNKVAQIKLFTVGDGFYPIGLIEPIYKTSLRKMNIEEALANAVWRHGFPIIAASVGDANHEPTPQQVQSILEKLRDISYKQELSYPYYYDLKILESKKSEKLSQHLEYFREQEVAGMGIPKPFATGGGEATNRATLGNQSGMFALSLRDIIDKTSDAIRQQLFRPICKLEGFKTVPTLKWDVVGADEFDNKVKRIVSYVKNGILTPEEVKDFIKGTEKMVTK